MSEASFDEVYPAAAELWNHYLQRWTRLNTIRTIAALAAALSFLIGLLRAA